MHFRPQNEDRRPGLDKNVSPRRNFTTRERKRAEIRAAETWGARRPDSENLPESSCLLANVLVRTVARNSRDLCNFVGAADAEDAGQAAALQHLELSPGEIAAFFLEDGNWELHPAPGGARYVGSCFRP